MPEYRLTPTPALGPGTPARAEVGSYAVEENQSLALASVAARFGTSEQVHAGLADLLVSAAPEPGAFVLGDSHAAFWIGPDQWMIAADHDGHELLAGELKTRFGDVAAVTEQNDGWVCLDVTGEDLPRVFERLTAADVGTLQGGAAVRTVIEHIGCFLLCLETDRHYRLVAGRSFAQSLRHAVLSAVSSTVAMQQQ